MEAKHPDWTRRQIECCLYWQPKARKQLKTEISKFRMEFPNYNIIVNPEAQGINVTETMAQIGIDLEWPPVNRTYQIVLGVNDR
jgi:hypothetical protein